MTRSPNSFASNEYAPGPRKKSAADVKILRILTTPISWSVKNKFNKPTTHVIIARKGVKKPSRRLRETKPTNETINKWRTFKEKLNGYVTFNANNPAAAILKRSSPIPGPP